MLTNKLLSYDESSDTNVQTSNLVHVSRKGLQKPFQSLAGKSYNNHDKVTSLALTI